MSGPYDGTISEEEHASVTHHEQIMQTTADILKKFNNRDPFLYRQVTFGRTSAKRLGKPRIIQFLQVGEEIGDLEVRIEVFFVKRGEE